MPKLLNKRMLQYIKHGYVLYGQDGIDLGRFKESYSNVNDIKLQYDSLYGGDLPKEYVQRQFENFLKENFVKVNDSSYFKKGSSQAEDYLFRSRLKQDPVYKDYWRDPATGQLYKKVTNTTYISNVNGGTPQPYTTAKYVKIDNDIVDPSSKKVILQANSNKKTTSNNNSSKPSNADVLAEATRNGEAAPHRYAQDEVEYFNVDLGTGKYRWAARYREPSDSKKPGWYWVRPGSTGFDSSGKYNILGEDNRWTEYTGDTLLSQIEREVGVSQNNSGNESGNDSGNNSGNDSGGNSGSNQSSIVSEFQPLETEAREFKPSVPGRRSSSGEYRLVRRPTTPPVARPANMPLMNRADVRYTISDVTKGSPYGSSDVELVNSLANTPDSNMFKQALMNRLGMSKWDNTTALNRLNYLGVRGHIGGSDRKRLRNLINKGTTVEGTIRKKQGGRLESIIQYKKEDVISTLDKPKTWEEYQKLNRKKL